MSAMFTPQINEVDRQTSQTLAGRSVETAGPLAMLPLQLLAQPVYDDFAPTNPFAQGEVDYSMYSESPVSGASCETSYAIAMSSFASAEGASFSSGAGSVSSDGGFSSCVSDGGCSGGGFSGGSCGGFTASC